MVIDELHNRFLVSAVCHGLHLLYYLIEMHQALLQFEKVMRITSSRVFLVDLDPFRHIHGQHLLPLRRMLQETISRLLNLSNRTILRQKPWAAYRKAELRIQRCLVPAKTSHPSNLMLGWQIPMKLKGLPEQSHHKQIYPSPLRLPIQKKHTNFSTGSQRS